MAADDTHVFPGFLTPVPIQLSFQGHLLLFSNASAEVRGENRPKRKFASTRSRTHNHQVMSLTHSPLSHQGGTYLSCIKMHKLCGNGLTLYHTIPTFNNLEKESFENILGKGENAGHQHFLLFPQCFYSTRQRSNNFSSI